jgi:hypothetical protein
MPVLKSTAPLQSTRSKKTRTAPKGATTLTDANRKATTALAMSKVKPRGERKKRDTIDFIIFLVYPQTQGYSRKNDDSWRSFGDLSVLKASGL